VAEGFSLFRDVDELRVKESDRVATIISELGALGAGVRYEEEGLSFTGGSTLRDAAVRSHGDHRIAMALAVAGLAADGTTVIDGWEAVATSYPGFEHDLERLCGS
jgi:3-phosphoshikimate 1-carboxyvinyltransferase